MSEIGIISKQYEQLVDTIDDFNAALIIFKKAFRFAEDSNRYKQFEVPEFECKDAIAVLSLFLKYLIDIFNNKEQPEYRLIPEKVLEKFKGSFRHEDDLKGQLKTIDKLINNDKLPNSDQFELLDRIVTTLDMERNKLSKKIRSARG